MVKRNLQAGRRPTGGINFSVLSASDLDRIHAATLEVLWKSGVFVEDEQALEVFDGGGARVDPRTRIVKIPPHVLEDAIRSAPEMVIFSGRDPRHDLVLEKHRVHFDCFGEAIKIVDPNSGALRETTKADLATTSRLVDALDNIDICHQSMGAHDVPPEVAALHNAEAILTNTTKHSMLGPQNGYLARKIIAMLTAIAGGEEKFRQGPVMTFSTCSVTPLKLPRDCCEIVIACARAGMQAQVLTQAMAGGTAPVTLAGTLVLHNAEVLSGLVLSQLVRRGTPFIYASSTCSLDLQYGGAVVGNPETALISAAVAEMARYYEVPCRVGGG